MRASSREDQEIGTSPLPTSLPETAASASGDASVVRYAYKASLIGAAHQFELTDDGVAWEIGGRSGLWRYGDISAIQLSYRPVSMQARRFRADLQHVTGRRIVILSTSWQTVALMAPQDQGYRQFIVALHARMAQAGSQARLNGGLGPGFYAASVALVTLVGLAMTGLLVRSLATGQLPGALFVVGFAALFAWQVGGFIRRNRPLAYDFDHLPETLLP
jgi:hypothetical protein